MPRAGQVPTLKVSTTTWARDSHDLFDYEARHVQQKEFYVQKPVRCYRTQQDVLMLPDSGAPPNPADYLIRLLAHKEGKFIVAPADRGPGPNNTPLNPKKLWLIVKDVPGAQHTLQEGDVIKLGRFKLRVRQIVTQGDAVPELRMDEGESPSLTMSQEELNTKQCRICLSDGCEGDDPIISPCQCKGSIEYVHVGCLSHWISGRLNFTADGGTYFYKQLQCELCKCAYPHMFNLNGTKVQVVKTPPSPAPFIVLENLVSEANTNRGLHVISMAERKVLKLGRGHESDVRIADVSISRYHATIKFQGGAFVVEDHNSKFGTLVAIRRPIYVDDKPVSVQVGRTVVRLEQADIPSAATFVNGVAEVPVPEPAPEGAPPPAAAPPAQDGDAHMHDAPPQGGAGNAPMEGVVVGGGVVAQQAPNAGFIAGFFQPRVGGTPTHGNVPPQPGSPGNGGGAGGWGGGVCGGNANGQGR